MIALIMRTVPCRPAFYAGSVYGCHTYSIHFKIILYPFWGKCPYAFFSCDSCLLRWRNCAVLFREAGMWLCPCWEQGDNCIPYKLYWELDKFRTVGTLSMCLPHLMPHSSHLSLLHLLTIIIWLLKTREGLLSWVSHAACFKISMTDLYFFITYLCMYSISTGELKHHALLKLYINKYFVFCTVVCMPVSRVYPESFP